MYLKSEILDSDARTVNELLRIKLSFCIQNDIYL